MNGDNRPSKQINDVLRGAMEPGAASQSVQSFIRFPVYRKACEILKKPKTMRAEEIEKCPITLREMLKQEIIRIYEYRKGRK